MNILEHLTVDLGHASRRHRAALSFKAKADARRSWAEKFADWMTGRFGSIAFLITNALWFFVWMVINLGWVPNVKPFDPFPFGLLTMVVSLEAIFLAIIVLISQNREAKIADLREELDLQINMMGEEEVSKIIELLVKLLEKQGVKVNDPKVREMLKPTPSVALEHRLERELDNSQN